MLHFFSFFDFDFFTSKIFFISINQFYCRRSVVSLSIYMVYLLLSISVLNNKPKQLNSSAFVRIYHMQGFSKHGTGMLGGENWHWYKYVLELNLNWRDNLLSAIWWPNNYWFNATLMCGGLVHLKCDVVIRITFIWWSAEYDEKTH